MSFDKTEYQLTLFLWQSTAAGDANRGNGLCKENHYIIFKIIYEFHGFGANRLMKECTAN